MASDDGRANGSGDENAEVDKVSSLQLTTTVTPAPTTTVVSPPNKVEATEPAERKGMAAPADPRGHSTAPGSEKTMAPASSTSDPSTVSTSDPSTVDVAALQKELADLRNQVSDLNGKLVTSFNRVSDLEDDLSEAKERAMSGTTRVAELEKERQEHLAALNTGLLVEKAHVSTEMQRMMDRVIEETKQRGQAESDKAKIESELDELSASLFGEANRMVAVERLARARADEKSRHMEERLQDTEGIMLEQQKVLGDLQRQLDSYRAAEGVGKEGQNGGQESSPSAEGSNTKALIAASTSGRQAAVDPNPYQDRRLLMLDIVPYQELRSFLDHLRKLRKQLAPFYTWPYDPRKPSGSRQLSLDMTSSNRSSTPAMGSTLQSITSLTSQGLYADYNSSHNGSASASSPFAIAGVSRHKDYPTLPSNCEQLVHIPSQLSLPFIKRAQEEDSDPCLRIDFAPGLNWLTRRTANTSVLEGHLLIEPIFPGGRVPDEEAVREQHQHSPPAACAMCGSLLVNVPLPGGEEAKSAAASSDLRTVSGWASSVAAATNSAALSLREAAGSAPKADATEKPPLKASRSGLFGSLNALRSKTGSPKPYQQSPAPIGEAEQEASPQAAGTSLAIHVPSLNYGSLPIPTHIFRISESSNVRYLICPHHCLVRLRAACAFWGFIRHIERAVVLEGKLAWDDQQNGGAAGAVVKPEPRRAPAAVEDASADSEPEKSDEAVTSNAKSDQALPVTDDSSATSSVPTTVRDDSVYSNDTAAHSDDGFHDADTGSVTPSGEEAPSTSSGNGRLSLPSKDRPQHLSLPETVQDGIVAEQGTDGASPAESTSMEQASADTTVGKTTSATVVSAPASTPAVPPRRPSVPSEGQTLPKLPPLPRRPTNPSISVASASTSVVTTAVDPPQRKTIRIDGVVPVDEKPLAWEEKVHLEVLRLKRMMWEARIGISE